MSPCQVGSGLSKLGSTCQFQASVWVKKKFCWHIAKVTAFSVMWPYRAELWQRPYDPQGWKSLFSVNVGHHVSRWDSLLWGKVFRRLRTDPGAEDGMGTAGSMIWYPYSRHGEEKQCMSRILLCNMWELQQWWKRLHQIQHILVLIHTDHRQPWTRIPNICQHCLFMR